MPNRSDESGSEVIQDHTLLLGSLRPLLFGQQAFQVAETFIDFYATLINALSFFDFEVGHDPQWFAEDFISGASQVDANFVLIQHTSVNTPSLGERLRTPSCQSASQKLRQADDEVDLLFNQFAQEF